MEKSKTTERKEMKCLKIGTFFIAMGAGAAVGALGAMMLPRHSEAYHITKEAADAIKEEAGKIIDYLDR